MQTMSEAQRTKRRTGDHVRPIDNGFRRDPHQALHR